ncbi:hypothetical protein DL96DRAFT_1623629 [Flagelloscypha sp. PMI_526]|nr:hypothetical protein DL96DRAFT_1623629 [Flagelloscypha sp. PMI_526]
MTDTDDPRGAQTGYNICNSTTENQDSMCQTMFVNHIDDFCLWAPQKPGSTIGDTEGEEVAWCTKKGHGTRLIPAGAITGLQFVQTPSYIQIAGTINQAMLNIQDGDFGGELDSGGQDGEGNPMGGLVYVNSFPSNTGGNSSYQQAQHWSFFMGGNAFCGKVCDQTGKNPQGLCQNIYDRLGCTYNAPNTAQQGVFESCKGDDMTPVGTYVVNGVTSVYTQPAETVSIGDVPYTPTPAPISNCVTFASSALFTDIASVTAAAGAATASSAAATSGASTGTGTAKGAAGTSKSTTGSAAASSSTSGNGASTLNVSLMSIAFTILSVVAFA